MSNLFSYFQRIEPKKMATTTADNESIRQANNTPKHNNNNNGMTTKNPTPKESLTSSRKSMNMSDVYSADSPKPEKRKQTSTITKDDADNLPKNKSETIYL
jgi:hypothetical protein